MVDNNWPINRYGQDLTKAIPNSTQTVGGTLVLQKSFMAQVADGGGGGLVPIDPLSLLGNPTSSAAIPDAVSLGSTLQFSGTTLQTKASTGDVTTPVNSFATTLATVNSNVGSFGSASNIPTITVNAKGLVTGASQTALSVPVAGLPGFSGGDVTGAAGSGVLSIGPSRVTNAMIVDGTINASTKMTNVLPVLNGGTGASTGSGALSNLGGLPLAGGTLSGPLILAGDPTLALGSATKQYVDSLAAGLSVKQSVAVATVADITLVGEQTIDGVLTNLSRILVKNQTLPAQNGIYITGLAGWTRAGDLDTWAEAIGAFTFVTGGGQIATGWVAQTTTPGTINTTPMPWAQYSASVAYTATAPITLTGNVFSISDGAITNAKLAGSITAAKLVGSDIATVGTITSGTWHGTAIGPQWGGTGQDFHLSTGVPVYTSGTAAIVATTSGSNAILRDAPNDGSQYARTSAAWTTINFLQAGTGAVLRTVQNKERDIVSVKDFGAVGDGTTDDTAAVTAAIAALSSGGTIFFPTGRYLISSDLNINSNTRFLGNGKFSSVIILNTITANRGVFNAPANPAINTYTREDIYFEHLGFDASLCTYAVWLSKLDGTPITDPQADYVMGSGLLAAGISGTSLTAIKTGDKITSVTIGSGGAGWRTHPTFPYLTNNITLNFVGGGATRPAFGYATVSGVGGTIISTTILEQGAGYTSVPSVIALGGYADIALLVQSSINRRNPNCLTRSFGIYLTQVNRCVISNCNFINLKSTAIQLLGCKDAIVEDCTFTGCGANDGDHIDVFITDYDSGGSTYVYGENCIVRRNQSRGDKRCFCFITQGKGGEFYGNNTEGAGMCSGGPGTNAASSSGQYWLTIRDNVAFNCPTSDFSASFCEITATRNIAFIDNVFNNCDGAMISAPGSRNMRFVRNSYFASQQATAQPVGYGPSSESFEFGVGQNPQIGFLRNPATNGAVTLGELNSEPMQDVICEDEIIYDDRGIDGPAMYHFFSSGTPSGQSGNIIIRNPRRSNYAATGLDSTTPITYVPAPTIFDSRFSIWVSGGAIDPSQGGQRIVHTFTAGTTGLVTISGVGFPAKRVNIWATSDASTDGRLFVGSLCWNLEVTNGGRIGGLASCFQTGVGQYAQNIDDAIQLIDAAGNNSFDTRFSSWTMDGFVLNVAFAPITCKMIFQCFAT